MSQTNDTAAICNRCKSLVPLRQGTIRMWNGAARRFAPKYATRSAYGVLAACHCNGCEAELKTARDIKTYNRRVDAHNRSLPK